MPGCLFLPKSEDVPGRGSERDQGHIHSESVRTSLSPCSNAMLSPRERGRSQDRSVCPAQTHLLMHWLTAQVLGSVRKLKQSLLPSITSQVPHHSDAKNCSIPPGFSSFGSTTKHPLFWFYTILSPTDNEAE